MQANEEAVSTPASSGTQPDLLTALHQHWALQRGTWNEMRDLIRLESRLATRAAGELALVAVLGVVVFVNAFIATQVLLALALISSGLSIAGSTGLLLAFNTLLLVVLVRRAMSLTTDVQFSHTREALRRPDTGEPADAAPEPNP